MFPKTFLYSKFFISSHKVPIIQQPTTNPLIYCWYFPTKIKDVATYACFTIENLSRANQTKYEIREKKIPTISIQKIARRWSFFPKGGRKHRLSTNIVPPTCNCVETDGHLREREREREKEEERERERAATATTTWQDGVVRGQEEVSLRWLPSQCNYFKATEYAIEQTPRIGSCCSTDLEASPISDPF